MTAQAMRANTLRRLCRDKVSRGSGNLKIDLYICFYVYKYRYSTKIPLIIPPSLLVGSERSRSNAFDRPAHFTHHRHDPAGFSRSRAVLIGVGVVLRRAAALSLFTLAAAAHPASRFAFHRWRLARLAQAFQPRLNSCFVGKAGPFLAANVARGERV